MCIYVSCLRYRQSHAVQWRSAGPLVSPSLRHASALAVSQRTARCAVLVRARRADGASNARFRDMSPTTHAHRHTQAHKDAHRLTCTHAHTHACTCAHMHTSRLVCAYSIYHATKVPCAAALPPDARRSAPHADVTLVRMREHERVVVERLPHRRKVREALQTTRGRALERARAPDEWT